MQKIRFDEAVRLVRKKDDRYQIDAYRFLREVLDITVKKLRGDELIEHRHVSGPELLDGFIEHAHSEYGSMAVIVLDSWGIRDSEDVGNVVFQLIEVGAFGKSEEDSPADFSGKIDLQQALRGPYQPTRQVLAARKVEEVPEAPPRGNKPVTPTEA